jgi:uncharacterized protein (DUF58 family)
VEILSAPQREERVPLRVLMRRYHFSVAGMAYVVTTMVLVLGAINAQNNLLFWLFGLAVAGLLVSGVLSGWSLMGLRIVRELPERATVGEPLRIRYTITNRNWLIPAFGLEVEELEATVPWFSAPARGDWQGRLPRVVTSVACVRPRGSLSVDVVVQPMRRGVATLNPVRVSSSFPFGITRKSVTFARAEPVLIRPRCAEVSSEALKDRSGVGATLGELRPSRTGTDFYALRDFQAGDTMRAVAWRASARLDRPVVRTYATPPGRRLWVMFDLPEPRAGDSPTLDTTLDTTPDTSEAVIEHVAGAAVHAVAQGREVGIVCRRGHSWIVLEPMRGGRRQIDLILDALARWGTGASASSTRADQAQSVQSHTDTADAQPAWGFASVLLVHAGESPTVAPPVAFVALRVQAAHSATAEASARTRSHAITPVRRVLRATHKLIFGEDGAPGAAPPRAPSVSGRAR